MACKDCGSGCFSGEGGCGPRKAEQGRVLESLVAELYPSRRWGDPTLTALEQGGVGAAEVLSLAEQLATVLKAPAYVAAGGDDDLCHFIYVLCVGREPSLIELRDEVGRDGVAGVWLESERLRERYLRVACSTLTRAACVQEVALELDYSPSSAGASDGSPAGMAMVREIPLPGVFDPPLLKRFQRTVDLLQAHDIEHLDMGLLDVDAATFGLEPGEYEARFGVRPALLNYFFYAQPVQTTTVSWLPAGERASVAS